MKKHDCLFCSILARETSARVIWEDADHMALLTPFPNTPGFTVLISKDHLPSDVLQLESTRLAQFVSAAKIVANLMRQKLNVMRVGFILEGYGIDHAHAKLIPMHGIPSGPWRQIASAPNDQRFYEQYPGFIASHDGPRMLDKKLDEIYAKFFSGS